MSKFKISDLKKKTKRDSYKSAVYDFDISIQQNINLKNTVFKNCKNTIDIVNFIVDDLSLNLKVKRTASSSSHYWAMYSEIAISEYHTNIDNHSYVAFHEIAHFIDNLFFNKVLPSHHASFLFCYQYILNYYNVISKYHFSEIVKDFNSKNLFGKKLPYIGNLATVQDITFYEYKTNYNKVKKVLFNAEHHLNRQRFCSIIINSQDKKYNYIVNNETRKTLKVIRNLFPFEKPNDETFISFSNTRLMNCNGDIVARSEYGGYLGFNILFDKKIDFNSEKRENLWKIIDNELNNNNLCEQKQIVIKKKDFSEYMVVLFEDDMDRNTVNKLKTVVKNIIKDFFNSKKIKFDMNNSDLIF